jgi:LysM repeat protein
MRINNTIILLIFNFIVIYFYKAQLYDSYPFINYEKNALQYHSSKDFESFYIKWKGLPSQTIAIAHLGDSQVQPDYFTGKTRELLQNEFGNSGRGMIFPYAMAKTYSQSDYTSTFTGNWITGNSIQTPPRVPVGISGFSAKTISDYASFAFHFKKDFASGPWIIKLYCDVKAHYKIKFVQNNNNLIYDLDTIKNQNTQNYIAFETEQLDTDFEFQIMRTFSDNTPFHLHGIIIERKSPGIIYHNLGVGGANFSAVLYHTYFEKQFPELNADLVILDWGGNDILYTNMIAPNLEQTIRSVIAKVRKSNPMATIVLTSTIDMWRKNKHITAVTPFASLVKSIAFSEHCLFYDWLNISGGSNCMNTWVQNKIAQVDRIHLTIKGYQLKGKLFTEAIKNSISYYANHPDSSFEFDYVIQDSIAKQLAINDSITNLTVIKLGSKNNLKKTKFKTKYQKLHIVKQSQTLSQISKRYGVSVSYLKRINNLKSDKIRKGQKIKIK